jgi:hypothetical protein
MKQEEISIIKKHFKKYLKISKKIKGKIDEEEEETNTPQNVYNSINVFIKIKNQNIYQKINGSINILLEFMRVITCSLLILFIPQKCGNDICSVKERMKWDSIFYSISLFFNFLTLLYFFCFYFLEIRRENVLIKYLDVNPEAPYDKKYVEKILEILPMNKKEKIIYTHKLYKKYANFLISLCTINIILSGFAISDYSIPNQTTSTFITYILFLLSKLNNVYSTASTENFIFNSAYLSTNVQFNDVDKKYKEITNEIL